MEFHIPLDKLPVVNKWLKEHNKTCVHYKNQGAIGGRLTYTFTPTGLGTIRKVKCACGEEKDVSNYEDW